MSNNTSTSPKPELSVENHAEVRKSEFHILNLGAGVQSTALYLMFIRSDLKPCIDYAIFADTQDEPQAVYRHLEWLQSLNGPPILIRTKGRLSDDLARGVNSTGQRFASIPAYTAPREGGSGSTGMTRRQCSREYKIEVVERALRREVLGLQPRQRIPKTVKIRQYYGISLDEAGRAGRIRLNWSHNSDWEPVFPLIDNFMTRADCLTYLVGKVPHETPRSACLYCPFHSDYEWNHIKTEDPGGWKFAVEVDRQLRVPGNIVNRNLDQQLFVHRSRVPLDLVQLDTRPDPRKTQTSLNFAAECMGICGV